MIRMLWTMARSSQRCNAAYRSPIRRLTCTRIPRLARAAPEDEDEGLLGELSDPLAPVRVAEFSSAIACLREIDPNNPNLTYLAPPHWVPSQDAIDRVNRDIEAALAAKQGATAASRPTWRQSEQDVGVELGPYYGSQRSYKDHKEVRYGEAGSVRPDFISLDGKTASFEVKNYDVNNNLSGLVKTVSEQAKKRQANLPKGMQQKIIIDTRGQNMSMEQEESIIEKIVKNTEGVILSTNIRFKR